MKQTILDQRTVFNLKMTGMGSIANIVKDLRKLANDLEKAAAEPLSQVDVEGEWEYRSIMTEIDLNKAESQDGSQQYLLMDEHPTKEGQDNLYFDLVANCVFTPNDTELAEIEEANAWDGYLLAVPQPE